MEVARFNSIKAFLSANSFKQRGGGYVLYPGLLLLGMREMRQMESVRAADKPAPMSTKKGKGGSKVRPEHSSDSFDKTKDESSSSQVLVKEQGEQVESEYW